MPAKRNREQIASRNLGWNIYFSRKLVDASLVQLRCCRQCQNGVTQVTLGHGLRDVPADRQLSNHGLWTARATLELCRNECLRRYLATVLLDNALTGFGSEIVMRVPQTEQ